MVIILKEDINLNKINKECYVSGLQVYTTQYINVKENIITEISYNNRRNISDEVIQIDLTIIVRNDKGTIKSTFCNVNLISIKNRNFDFKATIAKGTGVFKMIYKGGSMRFTSDDYQIDNKASIKVVWIKDEPSSISDCLLVQNYNQLNNKLPTEFQNLSYGIYPENVYYYLSRLVYNRILNFFPQVIFYPDNYKDVSYLIKNLYKYMDSVEFTIRCGGHAYESASLSNGIIIDVSKLTNVSIDITNKIITSQSGIKLGKLIDTLTDYKLIVPTGHNVCVGLSGLSLGGGKGELSRIHGLTSDNIISCKIINYKGEILNVNETENSDLLYGIRGAGTNNFGLILEMNLQAYDDLYYKVITFTWDWNEIKCLQVLKEYINSINNATNNKILLEFHMQANHSSNDDDIDNFYVKCTKFYRHKNEKDNFHEIQNFFTFNENVTITTDEGYYSQDKGWVDYGNGKIPPFSKIKSSMLYNNVNMEYLDILVSSITKIINMKIVADYQINISQLGGATKNYSGSSCYYPRDATSVISYFIQWTDQSDNVKNIDFINKIWTDFRPYASPYCFTNLIDYDIKNYMNSYYGENKRKLIKLKKKYDPYNFFHWKQSIPML